jgi:hypothetical protein
MRGGAPRRGRSRCWMKVKNLRELQTLLYQLIAGPQALNCDGEHGQLFHSVGRIIRSSQRLSALQRTNIYANAYFCRLLECLKEEFPAILAVVGPDDFADLVRDYLVWRPPTEPSIFYAGRYLDEFLRNHRLTERWPFIAELARLERATLESFLALDAPTLTDEAMRGIPPQQWPSIELRSHPAVKILRGEWRVSDVLSSVESGEQWREPLHQATTIIVWRRGMHVRYRNLEDVEASALTILREGASLAAICETVAAAAYESDQASLIGGLLARWLADGIMVPTA